MPSKENILDNITEYSASDLASYIRAGIVSYKELCSDPDFEVSVRKEVKALLEHSEDDDWQKTVDTNTIPAYDLYLSSYPEGKYRSQARAAKKRLSTNEETPVQSSSRNKYIDSSIKRLRQQIEGEFNPEVIVNTIKEYLDKDEITPEILYNEISENPNWLPAIIIERLEEEKIISYPTLETKAGIDESFFQYLTNNTIQNPVINVDCPPITEIGKKTTEVYFWGIPSSGKTCALGAILSEAQHGGYVEFAEPVTTCQGYHYMTVLSQTFNGRNGVFKLPEGTPTDAIFEMEFVLKKDRTDYPVTFIDLAGETIESMYRANARLPLNERKLKGLQTALRLLQGNARVNRKIHFFVLEYNGHNKVYQGLTQDTLLTGAMGYIKNTGIFKTETDAVYLLITKSDLTKANSPAERNIILKNYIEEYYKQFYNGLKSLCRENEINGGEVDIVPFSLGKVCFQNLCLFDKTTAARVIQLLIERAAGFKTGKFANFLKRLTK